MPFEEELTRTSRPRLLVELADSIKLIPFWRWDGQPIANCQIFQTWKEVERVAPKPTQQVNDLWSVREQSNWYIQAENQHRRLTEMGGLSYLLPFCDEIKRLAKESAWANLEDATDQTVWLELLQTPVSEIGLVGKRVTRNSWSAPYLSNRWLVDEACYFVGVDAFLLATQMVHERYRSPASAGLSESQRIKSFWSVIQRGLFPYSQVDGTTFAFARPF